MASLSPVTGASRRGMGLSAGRGRRSSPRSGASSQPGARPPSQLPGALCCLRRLVPRLAGRCSR